MASSRLILIALLSLAAANAHLRGSESTGQTVQGTEGEGSAAERHYLKSHEISRAARPKKAKRASKLTKKQKKARGRAKEIDSSTMADSIAGRTQAQHMKMQENEEDSYLVGGNHADKMEPHIINGDEALRGKYTFAVSLQDYGHFCGGSLIARDYVLSAAHCKGGRYSAVVGRHDLGEWGGQVIEVVEEIVHPNYNDWTSELLG